MGLYKFLNGPKLAQICLLLKRNSGTRASFWIATSGGTRLSDKGGGGGGEGGGKRDGQPDTNISGGRRCSKKKMFSALRASFWSKTRWIRHWQQHCNLWQKCTVPCKWFAQVKHLPIQKFARTGVNGSKKKTTYSLPRQFSSQKKPSAKLNEF